MSAAASDAPRLIAVVVFPTPPFWLAMAMTFPMELTLQDFGVWFHVERNQCTLWIVPRGTQLASVGGQNWSNRNNKTRRPVMGTSRVRTGLRTGFTIDVIQTIVVV